ncbi:MAG: hypothetical protein V2I43_08525 [Parvularcula sp.]|nr:hypothetical protein [Parvularcula sp.]
MTKLFDCYVAADWSAANKPVKGRDSIWLCAQWQDGGASHRIIENIPTRNAALKRIEEMVLKGAGEGRRMLFSFDFGFGYPRGTADALWRRSDWRGVWEGLAHDIEDDETNRSNRFKAAAQYNERLKKPVFWGRPPHRLDLEPHLPAKNPKASELPARRIVEGLVPRAKSLFQLSYAGAVGSQSLLGIAALERLRQRLEGRVKVKVWPFETAFDRNFSEGPSMVLAEIYPTLFLPQGDKSMTKDKAQVMEVVRRCADLDRKGALRPLLAPPPGLSAEDIEVMGREEGSILGAGRL